MFGNLIFKLKMKHKVKELKMEDEEYVRIQAKRLADVYQLVTGKSFDLPTKEETPDFVDGLDKELKGGYNG